MLRLDFFAVSCHCASIVSIEGPFSPPHLPTHPGLIPLSVGRQAAAPVWLTANVEALGKSLCQAGIRPRC